MLYVFPLDFVLPDSNHRCAFARFYIRMMKLFPLFIIISINTIEITGNRNRQTAADLICMYWTDRGLYRTPGIMYSTYQRLESKRASSKYILKKYILFLFHSPHRIKMLLVYNLCIVFISVFVHSPRLQLLPCIFKWYSERYYMDIVVVWVLFYFILVYCGNYTPAK